MLKKIIFYFLLVTLATIEANSQDAVLPAFNQLQWNEFYKLQWEDFRGEPDKDSHGDAATAVQISAKPFLVKKEIRYDVVALFNRSKSWARDKSPSLLVHEQLHFDIAELYARKIRKKIRELNAEGVKDIKIYNAAIRALLLESNEADEHYDLETLHGALSKTQAAWSEKVMREMATLQRYKKPKRIVGG